MLSFLNSKSLKKYARTYLLLMICVVLMVIPLYFSAYSLLQNRELEVNSALLQNGAAKLDQEIASLTTLVQGSYSDNRYRVLSSSYRILQISDYFSINQVQRDFQRIISPQTIITDCGILFNSGFILTKFRNFPQGNFYGTYFQVEGMDFEQWQQSIVGRSAQALIGSQDITSQDYGRYDALTWISPVTQSESSYQQGYFYGTIKASYLLDQLVPDNVQSEGFVLITDVTGKVLLNHQYPGNAKGFITYSGSTSSTGLNILAGIPYTSFSSQLAPMRLLLMVYLLIVLLLGFALSLYLAYRSSLPISQLVAAIASNQDHPPAPAEAPANDYDFIRQAFTGINKTLGEYTSLLNSQKDILQRNIFEKLLSETSAHSQEELADFQKFFPDFPERFQIALIQLAADSAASLEIRISRQVVLQQQIVNRFPAEVYAQFLDSSSAALLLPVDEPGAAAPDYWFNMLCSLKQLNQEANGLSMRMALSEAFQGHIQLADAYLQARHILQLSGSNEDIQVWRLTNFPVSQARFPLDYNNLQQLYNALTSGKEEAVDSIIQTLGRRIRDFGYADELIYRQIFYNIRGVLLSIKLEQITLLASIEIPIYNSKSEFMNQLDEVTACCHQICRIISAQEPNEKDSFADSVIRFIDDNLANQELYTRTVTQHFNIGVTTLQKIIHTATGKSFFEYVEDHRIENAYNLLTNTTLSINEIAGQCGFSSYNSLYKSFQRRYNIPPGSIKNRLQDGHDMKAE